MKRKITAVLSVLLLGAGSAFGQPEPTPPPLAETAPMTPYVSYPAWAPIGPRIWGSAETLLWWTRSGGLPPTLTTFAPGSTSATTGFGGALGVAGTTVLSPDHLNSGMRVGGQSTLGGWLGDDQRFGWEASGFFLANRSSNFAARSDDNGNPPLRVPFINVPPGAGFPLGESSFVLADPRFARGSQTINSSLRFWGAEADGLFQLNRNVSLLVGFRYLDLRDDLTIISNETTVPFGAYTGIDNFATRNNFYGGQLGLKAQSQFGRLDAGLVAKVALGANNETVSVNGSSNVTAGFGVPAGTYPGGIFTQSTNIGQRSRDVFCVVPEVRVQLGYAISPRLRAFCGYDFLYMSNVLRAGDQIDRTLNFTSSSAISGAIPPTLVGAPRPAPQFNASGFWAQGVNLGFEFRY